MKVEVKQVGTSSQVKLRGAIGDGIETALRALSSESVKSDIVIDCSGIDYINSIGAGAWVQWIERFSRDRRVVLESCPIHFIEYASLLPTFCGQATISSLYVPFVCADCDHDVALKMQAQDCSSDREASQPCGKCGKPMAMAADPGVFFACLAR